MSKILITKNNKHFLVKDESKDYHSNFGFIKSTDMIKAKPGEIVTSNKGTEFHIMNVSFIDLYNKIKRQAQIIPKKDIGYIITETGLNKDSIVIETGAGSGATGSFFAKICKKVIAYEIRKDYVDLVKENIKNLDIKNYTVKHKDAKLGFSEKNVDLILLDLPSPWDIINASKNSLKVGGFLVSYSPTIPQVMDFVSALDDSFTYIKTSEIIDREWEINDRKVRPRSQAIGHSGFLSFARKIQ